MKADRELLEAAARAAGIRWDRDSEVWYGEPFVRCDWNPLIDDGDALRLAVQLNIGVMSAQYTGRTCVWIYCKGKDGEFFEEHGADIFAATRRAIVRAAAAIGAAVG